MIIRDGYPLFQLDQQHGHFSSLLLQGLQAGIPPFETLDAFVTELSSLCWAGGY